MLTNQGSDGAGSLVILSLHQPGWFDIFMVSCQALVFRAETENILKDT